MQPSLSLLCCEIPISNLMWLFHFSVLWCAPWIHWWNPHHHLYGVSTYITFSLLFHFDFHNNLSWSRQYRSFVLSIPFWNLPVLFLAFRQSASVDSSVKMKLKLVRSDFILMKPCWPLVLGIFISEFTDGMLLMHWIQQNVPYYVP